ncbi:hypothetical protein Vadar_025214 [Vaccinium darrowii]|uniref:Uncharacterized protein n=1 Tax=Vaccinium darrowii TaxID=229202 RepID=A0ACB7Y1J7_9ERIC|nr:hypothetical protein Vadar_025214 [Vaccinium darrowii]
MADVFDSSLNLEETHFKEGFNEGYNDGITSGKEEGRQRGLIRGFEIGEELGFYMGCVDIWTSAIRVDPNCFSPRNQKNIKTLDNIVKSVTKDMDSLRLNFRLVCASLNVKKLKYSGYRKGSDANMEV